MRLFVNNSFSFCKFHIPENQKKVIWEITNECNYSCEYCIFSSTGKKPRGELNFIKVMNTLHELKDKGFSYIKFTGGEPFLRKDFLSIIQQANQLNFQMDISTNASHIDLELAFQLSQIPFSFIHVSIDGYNELSHECVRGKHTFQKTINGLKNLLHYSIPIRVGCVIHSENEYHLQKIVDFMEQLGVPKIIFSKMAPIGKLKNQTKHLAQQSTEDLIFTIENLHKKNIIVEHNLYSDTIQPISFQPSLKYCPGGDQFLFINHLGIVSPCTWISDEFPEFHHLSLSDFSLEEIFQHFTFQKFIQLKHQKINQCFLQYYQKEPLFQKLYAFSTENLHYLSQLPIKNKSHALTITGSGDQALELILLGFKNIYLIDIQPFSQYFAELKFIAIQHLSLQEFKKFFYISEQSFSYHSYQKLRQFLSPICESFWNIEYQKHQFNGYLLRTSSLFKTEYEKQSQHEKNIPYLTNPSQYLFLQEALEKVSIEFLTGDYQTYSFKQKYDCILLSNIADYSHKIFPINSIQNFKTYFVQKSFSHLNEQGFLMFAYIYDYENQHNSHLRNPINSLEQRKSFFSDLEYQELLIKSAIENIQYDVVCYLSHQL